MAAFLIVGAVADVSRAIPARHVACTAGSRYAHTDAYRFAPSAPNKPSITASGEPLPGAVCPGATTVTPEPSAEAQEGWELEQPATASSTASAHTTSTADRDRAV